MRGGGKFNAPSPSVGLDGESLVSFYFCSTKFSKKEPFPYFLDHTVRSPEMMDADFPPPHVQTHTKMQSNSFLWMVLDSMVFVTMTCHSDKLQCVLRMTALSRC